MADTQFVIVGFPRCGSSDLLGVIRRLKGVQVDLLDGKLEAPFYLDDDGVQKLAAAHVVKSGEVNGHKCSNYILNQTAMRRIAEAHPEAWIVVCLRDPRAALLSWREQHRDMARSGRDPEHFAYKDPAKRSFFLNASLQDYVNEFALDKLKYADRIRMAMSAAPNSRFCFVYMDALAEDPYRVLNFFSNALDAPLTSSDKTRSGTQPLASKSDDFKVWKTRENMPRQITDESKKLRALMDEIEDLPRVKVIRSRAKA